MQHFMNRLASLYREFGATSSSFSSVLLWSALWLVGACRPIEPLPTLARLPTAAPPLPTLAITALSAPLAATTTPNPTPALMTPTLAVSFTPLTSRPSLSTTPAELLQATLPLALAATLTFPPTLSLPTPSPVPVGFPTPTFGAQAAQLPPIFTIGTSVQGRAIDIWRIGNGPQAILLVGGIHGGWERNTTALVQALIQHFSTNPDQVLPQITLLLLPTLNPDGAALGQTVDGRFNANGVDLNRNWACDWANQAEWRQGPVDPGPNAFSEPETQAMVRLVRAVPLRVALFYHSAANGIFSGDCEGRSTSGALAEVLGNASGYPFGAPFSLYRVTGTAANWMDGQGIAAADVELSTSADSELERNLSGIMALQCWLAGTAADEYSVCE
jgi:murein peptide amidase A